jgi:hypothetical protein
MRDVLTYFNSGGRSIGLFCDNGLTPKEIWMLMRRRNRPQSAIREYEGLYATVARMAKENPNFYRAADENSQCIPLRKTDNTVARLVPLGPNPTALKLSARAVLAKGRIQDDLNLLSLVLFLTVRNEVGVFDAIFLGDMAGDGVNRALQRFDSDPEFDLVKVAHHGSLDSHTGSRIVECGKSKLAIAAICSGADYEVLPDREVMREFLEQGWRVLLTCKRLLPRKNSLIDAFGKVRLGARVQGQTVRVFWSGTGIPTWSPENAEVLRSELENYSSAEKN